MSDCTSGPVSECPMCIAALRVHSTFQRVYQGGHHDVYCNGAEHVWLAGDQVGRFPISRENHALNVRVGGCDCAKYRVNA